MACELLAQAPETVKFTPFRLKITERFIETVEFIDWKMLPEPIMAVSFVWRTLSIPSTTAAALLSLP